MVNQKYEENESRKKYGQKDFQGKQKKGSEANCQMNNDIYKYIIIYIYFIHVYAYVYV